MRVRVHVCISVAVVRGFFHFFFLRVCHARLSVHRLEMRVHVSGAVYVWIRVCIRVSDQCTCLSVI